MNLDNNPKITNPEVKELLLQLTNACNFECFFCGNDPNLNRNLDKVMTFETIKRMIDEIHPYSASFTGGEVTMVWDRMVEGLLYAKSKEIFNIVNTTLSLLTKEKIDFLIKDCGVIQFNVSFNDLDENMSKMVRGSSKYRTRVIENIQYITHTYPEVALNVETLLLKNTLDKIPEMHTLLCNLGVKCHKLSFMTPLGHAQDAMVPDLEEIKTAILKTYQVKPKGHMLYLVCCYLTPCMPEAKEIYEINDEEFRIMSCSEGRSTLYISVQGNISPCFIYHGETENIATSNVRDVWENGEPFKTWRHEVNETCTKCPHWFSDKAVSCHNGCSSLLLRDTGNLKSKCGEYMRDYFTARRELLSDEIL